MADHSTSHSHSGDMEAHRATYEGFVRGSVALTLMCISVLLALATFRFGHAWSVFMGFLTLFVGLIAPLIDLKTGSKRWTLSLVLLVIFGVLTASTSPDPAPMKIAIPVESHPGKPVWRQLPIPSKHM